MLVLHLRRRRLKQMKETVDALEEKKLEEKDAKREASRRSAATGLNRAGSRATAHKAGTDDPGRGSHRGESDRDAPDRLRRQLPRRGEEPLPGGDDYSPLSAGGKMHAMSFHCAADGRRSHRDSNNDRDGPGRRQRTKCPAALAAPVEQLSESQYDEWARRGELMDGRRSHRDQICDRDRPDRARCPAPAALPAPGQHFSGSQYSEWAHRHDLGDGRRSHRDLHAAGSYDREMPGRAGRAPRGGVVPGSVPEDTEYQPGDERRSHRDEAYDRERPGRMGRGARGDGPVPEDGALREDDFLPSDYWDGRKLRQARTLDDQRRSHRDLYTAGSYDREKPESMRLHRRARQDSPPADVAAFAAQARDFSPQQGEYWDGGKLRQARMLQERRSHRDLLDPGEVERVRPESMRPQQKPRLPPGVADRRRVGLVGLDGIPAFDDAELESLGYGAHFSTQGKMHDAVDNDQRRSHRDLLYDIDGPGRAAALQQPRVPQGQEDSTYSPVLRAGADDDRSRGSHLDVDQRGKLKANRTLRDLDVRRSHRNLDLDGDVRWREGPGRTPRERKPRVQQAATSAPMASNLPLPVSPLSEPGKMRKQTMLPEDRRRSHRIFDDYMTERPGRTNERIQRANVEPLSTTGSITEYAASVIGNSSKSKAHSPADEWHGNKLRHMSCHPSSLGSGNDDRRSHLDLNSAAAYERERPDTWRGQRRQRAERMLPAVLGKSGGGSSDARQQAKAVFI